MIEELAQYDATALGELVRKGEITPTELLERALGRLERVNARLNAVVHTTYDHARIAIRHGPSHGPLRAFRFS